MTTNGKINQFQNSEVGAIIHKKILGIEEFSKIRKELRVQGKIVVQCHGVFDLLHPGHIEHLQEARSFGDVLVVTVTSAPYVNKGPGRPYFNDELRMNALAAVEAVDYVILSSSLKAIEVIKNIKPDFFVKGQEFVNLTGDFSGNISEEAAVVERNGGQIRYTKGFVSSSTRLLNEAMPVMAPELKKFLMEYSKLHNFEEMQDHIEKMR